MLVISPLARDDLDDIWWNIAQDDPIAATGVIDFLTETFLNLEKTPTIGRIRPELWPDALCFTAFQSGWRSRFLVFYLITDGGIKIARVLEGHRDISSELFE